MCVGESELASCMLVCGVSVCFPGIMHACACVCCIMHGSVGACVCGNKAACHLIPSAVES